MIPPNAPAPTTSVFMNPPSCLLGLSGKAEASSVRSADPEALRLVEARYPVGYFGANTPAPVFSCPAAKEPVAAFSMK